MSDALRAIFAEFGFDIDFDALDKLDGDLKALADAAGKSAEAAKKKAAELAEASKKAAEEAKAAAAAAAEASKSGDKEAADAAKKAADEKADAAKKAADAAKKAADESKKADKAAEDAAKKAAKAQEDRAKKIEADAEKLKSFGGVVDVVSEKLSGKLGAQLITSNKRVAELAQRFGLSAQAVGNVATALTVASAAAAAFAAHMAFAFGTEFAAGAEALRDTARESRVTTSELQGLDHAAEQAGVGVERMRSGLHAFGEALRQGERWGNGTTWALRRLGIQARDSNGHIRPTVDLMDEVAVALERVESPYRRARVAQQLFGESGRRMLDVLHSGPGGVRALRDELEELGGGVTPEAVEASRAFTQAQERQGRAMDSLRSVLATSLLPALTWWLNLTARAEGLLARLTRGTHVTELALGGLGVVGVAVAGNLLAAWWPVLAPFVATAAKVALLVAIFDDLITFVEGGDSAIGRFIDTTFGVGTSAELVKELRDDWEDLVGWVEKGIKAVSEFFDLGPEAPAVGTLRAPTYGPQRGGAARGARAVRAGAATPAAAASLARGAVAVAAPGVVAPQRTTVTTVDRRQSNVFHLAGPDARQLAREVGTILEQQQRAERDADHPQEDED